MRTVITSTHTPPASPSPPLRYSLQVAGEVAPSNHPAVTGGMQLEEDKFGHGVLTPPRSPSPLCSGMMLDGKANSQPASGSRNESSVIKSFMSTGNLRRHTVPTRPATPPSPSRTFRSPKLFIATSSTQSTKVSFQQDSTGSSSGQPSTAKTTPNSSGSGSSSGTVVRRRSSLNGTSNTGSNAMEPIGEFRYPKWPKEENTDPFVEPTIRTVELASAAKVYMEHQYRSEPLASARSRRLASFERGLKWGAFTGPKLAIAKQQYKQSESNDLRRQRLARSRTLKDKRDVRASVADFEVIRVLGKGSFGVVRLVRKRRPRSVSFNDAVARDATSINTGDVDGALPRVQGIFEATATARGQFYAMKVIRKSAMLRGAQEGHLRAERDFLVLAAKSHWVVTLEAAFQDNTNLYLVMDYMVGGDFLGLLLREDVIDEEYAAFYIAEMILCIEESHKLGWIHRDVKPDNFLIDSRGHLKISDFGLSFDGDWSHNQGYYSKQRYDVARTLKVQVDGDSQDARDAEMGISLDEHALSHGTGQAKHRKSEPLLQYMDRVNRRRYATSVVGTSQYMAPEVIRGDMYDGRCDWWSIGIVLYECLYGKTPFYCESRLDTKNRILQHKTTLVFPRVPRINQPWGRRRPLPDVSDSAVDLMARLLVERQDRLCTSRYKANDRAATGKRVKASSIQSWTPYPRPVPEVQSNQHPNRERIPGHSCVYADDAKDIKCHPFFSDWKIDFANIHNCDPPRRPRIRADDSITKYFDDENDIISGDEADLDQSSDDGDLVGQLSPPYTRTETYKSRATRSPSHLRIRPATPTQGAVTPDKAFKRPRDKILRDPQVGKVAMALRKRRAFLGYTYRKPNIWSPHTMFPDNSGRYERVRGEEDARRDFSTRIVPPVAG